ncbi:MAG: type II toxin-antitoxin system HicA family toxin [Gammaproteobacteria bacterium]|nr:type II toxin-antitoxin system HicA family toxin [Gammaproteobacteria bacterium]
MCRVLESKGWQLKRIRGSHFIYAKKVKSPAFQFPFMGLPR